MCSFLLVGIGPLVTHLSAKEACWYFPCPYNNIPTEKSTKVERGGGGGVCIPYTFQKWLTSWLSLDNWFFGISNRSVFFDKFWARSSVKASPFPSHTPEIVYTRLFARQIPNITLCKPRAQADGQGITWRNDQGTAIQSENYYTMYLAHHPSSN
jgi:hypothetical protein